MPHACEDSKTEEAAPVLSAIRSDLNRLFGTVPEREIREDRNNHLVKTTGSSLHIFGSQRGGVDPTICLRYASERGILRSVKTSTTPGNDELLRIRDSGHDCWPIVPRMT